MILSNVSLNKEKESVFTNRRKGLTKAENILFDTGRNGLSQALPSATPVPFRFLDTRQLQYHQIDLAQTLKSAQSVTKIKQTGGKIATFDLETLGGFEALDFNHTLTPNELNLRSVTEFAIHTQHIGENGVRQGSPVQQLFAFGIDASQEQDYELFFARVKNLPLNTLSSSDRSTLERLSRYANPQAFRLVDGKYELTKLGDATLDIVASYEGYRNLLTVGRHQGFGTRLGQTMYQQALNALQGADIVSGYNILNFDLKVLDEISDKFHLKKAGVSTDKVYDVMTSLRASMQGKGFSELHQMAKHFGIKDFNPSRPGSLEALAEAIGHQMQAHFAMSDVETTKEIGIFKKVFGDQFNLDLPTYTTQQVGRILSDPNLMELTPENIGHRVVQANRSLYGDAKGFDFMTIDGERQDYSSWVMNRGEYYRTNGVQFISKDELAKQMGLEEAQKVLDYYKNDQGVYTMTFNGASQHNSNRRVQLFRGQKEDFQSVVNQNLTVSNRVKSNQAIVGPYDVTQTAIDRATRQAMEDRARRDIVSALRNNGEFSASQLERMYAAYGQIETAIQQQGYTHSKSNFIKAINGELEGVNVSSILKEHRITARQREKMGLAHGFFKHSHEFMTGIFGQINELITPTGVKRAIGAGGNVNEALDRAKQVAIAKFLEPFEFGDVRMGMTESNAFTIQIPQFDRNGKMIEGMSQLNVLKVTDGTSQLNRMIQGVGARQGDSIAQVQRNKMLRQIVENLESRRLLPKGSVVINDAAAPYNAVQSIVSNLNAQIQTLMNTEELGVKQAIMSNRPINVLQIADQLDRGVYALPDAELHFAQGYLAEKAAGTETFSLNTAKVRYKNPTNKTQEVAMGIGSYFKRNRINSTPMILDAVQSAYDNLGIAVVGSGKSFEQFSNVLKEQYHYSESNIETIRRTLFQKEKEHPITGEKTGGMVEKYGMDVTFFEQDGKLYLGAVDPKKNQRFTNAIIQGKTIEDLKEMGVVVGLPTIDESLGTRTIKTGTVHKGIPKRLNVYANERQTGEAAHRLNVRQVDTVDDALKFWIVGQKTAMQKVRAGDTARASQILNSLVTTSISEAPSLTANQAIRVKDAAGNIVYKYGVVPNINDYELENLIQYGKLYNFLPMLYDKDEEVRRYVNKRFLEQEGLNEFQAAARIDKWKQDIANKVMQDAGGSGGETYLKEFFMDSLRVGDYDLLGKIIKHGSGTLDEESLQVLSELRKGSIMGQVLTESKTKSAYLSQTNVLERNPYGPISDIGRANQNAGFNTIQYNPDVFTAEELTYLDSHGIRFGRRITTDVDFQKGRYDHYESHITGKLKTMHSHEAIQAVHRTRSQSAEILAKYGNRFTQKDLEIVLNAFEFNANTYEQRLILNPLLRDTVWADPELIGIQTEGLTETQLNELVQTRRRLQTGDTIGTYQADGLQKQLTYDKQVAGRIVSREGNTLYLFPDQRQVGAVKLSIGGLEKGMAVAVDLGDAENERLKPLLYDVWQRTYGNVAVVGNPEMGKHMAGGLTVGRYTSTVADTVMGNERMEEKFLSVMNKYLPEWNARFVDNQKGERLFIFSGDPDREAGNVKGFLQIQESIAELAKEDKDFATMDQAIRTMFKNEEYLTSIARTTNSEQHPANAVKVTRRSRQIMGTAGTEGYGVFHKGRFKRYGRILADFEDELLSQTDAHQEGKRMVSSIRSALKGMLYGDAADVSNKILTVNYQDFAIPKSGLMAEDMNETFFGVLGRRYQDKFDQAEALKIKLGDIKVINPMTGEYEDFIYFPKVMTQVVDGKVYLNKSNKGMADLLTAIEVLKNGKSELSYEDSLAKINDLYAKVVGQFFDEFAEKDGIFNKMVLEGRIGHSARGLGSNIYAPVLEGMVTGEVDGVKMTAKQVAEGAVEEIKNGGKRRFFKFYDQHTYRHAAQEQADGSLKFYDVVHTSRKQFERMGVEFDVIGEQALSGQNFSSPEEMQKFTDLLKAHDLTQIPVDESVEVTKAEVDAVLKDMMDRKKTKYDKVSITASDKEKALEVAKKMKITQQQKAYYEQVGELFVKEIGIFGTNARDPLFLTTSKNVVRVYMDERILDNSWHIFSLLGKKLNQDTDGDSTSLTLLMKNGKMLSEEDKVVKAARALHEAQAESNLKTYMSQIFDGYLLNHDKTGRVDVENGKAGDDIRAYIRALEEQHTAKDKAGEIKDNNFKNKDTVRRAIKNRQNKDAIGYLSVPNYQIREAAEAAFAVEGKTNMLESLYHFTNISEQKILDTKHVRSGVHDVTRVSMYRTGVRNLFSEKAMADPELQKTSLQQVIDSFKGPVFSTDGLDIQAPILMGDQDLRNVYTKATEDELEAMESIRSLYRLSQEQEAIDIMNNPFMKSKAWWSDEQKIEALKKGIKGEYAPTRSLELKAKMEALKGDPVIGVRSDDLLLNTNGRYGTDAYRYTGAGKTQQGMFYGELESVSTGDSIRVYANTEAGVKTLIDENFVKSQTDNLEQVMQELSDGYSRDFIESATGSHSQFVQRKIEAEVANEILYNNGKLSIIDLEDMVHQKVALNSVDEGSEAVANAIIQRVRGYTPLETHAVAQLHDAYFNTTAGIETEKFARTVELMAEKKQVKASSVSQMIRQFNEDIREKGRVPRESRATIVRNNTPSNLSFTNAQLDALEREAQQRKAFQADSSQFLDLDRLKENYARYNLEDSKATMMDRVSSYRGSLPDDQFDEIIAFHLDQLRTENFGRQMEFEKMLSSLVDTDETSLLGWVDANEINRTISSMSQPQIDQTIQSLEQSVITHGQFAGARIGDLSIEDLHRTLSIDESSVISSQRKALQGTKQQVEAYFAALDNSSNASVIGAIEDRATTMTYRTIRDEQIEMTVKELNDGIRKAAKKSTSQIAESDAVTKNVVERIFSKTGGKVAMGVGLAVVAASAISGMQFSASQKTLSAEQDNPYITRAKTASRKNQAPSPRYAPASESTTYLNQDHQYKISARHHGQADIFQSSQLAARTTGSNQVRVVNSDNRNEISKQWLQQQVIELI